MHDNLSWSCEFCAPPPPLFKFVLQRSRLADTCRYYSILSYNLGPHRSANVLGWSHDCRHRLQINPRSYPSSLGTTEPCARGFSTTRYRKPDIVFLAGKRRSLAHTFNFFQEELQVVRLQLSIRLGSWSEISQLLTSRACSRKRLGRRAVRNWLNPCGTS